MTHDSLLAIAAELHFPDIEALYAAVGGNRVSPDAVVKRMVDAVGGVEGNEEDLVEITRPGAATPRQPRDTSCGVTVSGLDDVLVKLARCCTPMPIDEIVGFVTHGSGVSVHRTDCSNAAHLESQPERIVEVEWSGQGSNLFMVQIEVEALDRHHLLSDVTTVLSNNHVSIMSASVHTTKDRLAYSRFVFEMAEPQHLDAILASVAEINSVFQAYRITGTGARRPASLPRPAPTQ